ncbi:SAP domain-containing protein [Amycolatopsis sp. NPDC001319]|uniref:SAP domain-containing protein n=1 Tax=unclassified Amycolatopsis TaxID=2618356 RepID=UPI0036B974AB
MATWECRGCTAAYSVGAPRCPQCGANDPIKEDEQMAKITVHGGASDASLEETTTAPAEQPADGYDAWTVDQLKAELGERGLSKSGNKDELIERLTEHDGPATGAEDSPE